jgi:hypothetical protein
MERKYALLMDLPGGKLPGFYAQIVKALANKAPLFDRDKETLIFSSEADRQAAANIMNHYGIHYDYMELWLLPKDAKVSSIFSDFGFASRAEHMYVYADQVSLFRFSGGSRGEEEQALQQMEEHLIAFFSENGIRYYAVETHLMDLMHGIAKAYNCEITVP